MKAFTTISFNTEPEVRDTADEVVPVGLFASFDEAKAFAKCQVEDEIRNLNEGLDPDDRAPDDAEWGESPTSDSSARGFYHSESCYFYCVVFEIGGRDEG